MSEKTDHDRIVELHTVLLGADGEGGFIEEVRRQNTENAGALKDLYKKHDNLSNKHNNLSRKFYWLVGFLIGSGILAGSIAGTIIGIN